MAQVKLDCLKRLAEQRKLQSTKQKQKEKAGEAAARRGAYVYMTWCPRCEMRPFNNSRQVEALNHLPRFEKEVGTTIQVSNNYGQHQAHKISCNGPTVRSAGRRKTRIQGPRLNWMAADWVPSTISRFSSVLVKPHSVWLSCEVWVRLRTRKSVQGLMTWNFAGRRGERWSV